MDTQGGCSERHGIGWRDVRQSWPGHLAMLNGYGGTSHQSQEQRKQRYDQVAILS